MRLAIAIVIAAAGCTFCYQSSKFEIECHERGGTVRSLDTTQLCVTDKGVAVSTGVVDEDAGN